MNNREYLEHLNISKKLKLNEAHEERLNALMALPTENEIWFEQEFLKDEKNDITQTND